MKIWLDAHLSPALGIWLNNSYRVECTTLRQLGLDTCEDLEVFLAARDQGAAILTKDRDMIDLQQRLGSPPKLVWLRIGNSSTARLTEFLSRVMPSCLELLESGEPLVELRA